MGELGDVVGFHLAGALAHLTSSCLEPFDELCAADDARGWLTVGEDRVSLPFQRDTTESGGQRFPAGAFDGCLQARAWPVRGGDGGLVAGRHLRHRRAVLAGVGWAAQRGPGFISRELGPFPGSLPPNPACPLSGHRAFQRFMPRARSGLRGCGHGTVRRL